VHLVGFYSILSVMMHGAMNVKFGNAEQHFEHISCVKFHSTRIIRAGEVTVRNSFPLVSRAMAFCADMQETDTRSIDFMVIPLYQILSKSPLFHSMDMSIPLKLFGFNIV
jgi:hypothetical protein